MDYFPLFADLRDRPCLIVGAGQVAARKLRLLQNAGARVTLVAPRACAQIAAAHRAGAVTWRTERFAPAHIGGHLLVIAATNRSAVNDAVAQAARAAGRFCNVVDDPARCSFITPAIVDRGAVTVAISSGGRAPVLARWLKARIEDVLPARVGELATLAARWRHAVKQRLGGEAQRRRFWQRVFAGPVARDALGGRIARAERGMTRLLSATQDDGPDGIAWLVGAGPGGADLITRRGAALLREADVVVHDALVTPDVLELARRDATFIDVGKRAGHHALDQDAINRLLVERVRAGERVCRLKGGDPFTFGRGGEEALALAQAALPFEIVPGVTAAAASSALAGIPLTHRGLADSVTFVTAHGCQPGHTPDYADLADARRTVVFYMGARRLHGIGRGLIAHGRGPDTPVAIVEKAATREQRVRLTTLSALATGRAGDAASPATVIVGEVARLHGALAWHTPAASDPAFAPRPGAAGGPAAAAAHAR